MDAINIAGIIVSAIAGASAFAAQRAASKATTINTNTTTRVDMEKEAYIRARNFDIDTIKRQDEEIRELRENEDRLMAEIRKQGVELRALRQRLARLERGMSPESEEPINERYEDDNPLSQ